MIREIKDKIKQFIKYWQDDETLREQWHQSGKEWALCQYYEEGWSKAAIKNYCHKELSSDLPEDRHFFEGAEDALLYLDEQGLSNYYDKRVLL